MAWPDGGDNEVIATIGSGPGRTFAAITDWEAWTDNNCVTGAGGTAPYDVPCSPVGECYDDGDFNEGVWVESATCDATHYRGLTAHVDSRHEGKMGAGVFVVSGIGVAELYFVVEWMQTINTSISLSWAPANSRWLASNCIISRTTDWSIGFRMNSSGAGSESTCRNCIAYGTEIHSDGLFHRITTAQNCTAIGKYQTGFEECATCTNCIGVTITSGAPFHASGGDYNISSDTSSPGAHSIDNIAAADLFANVGAGTEDLHLKAGAAAIGAGTDLSAYFTDDIDGQTRPTGANTWDIGADQYSSGAVAVAIAARLFAGNVYNIANAGVNIGTNN